MTDKNNKLDFDRLHKIGLDLLLAIGEDPNREGLMDTPERFARMWQEFIDFDAGNADTTFESVTSDQMVVVSGIRVWSMCEHHLLPFYCDLSIAYIAKNRILGLSKFARIAQEYAHKLQVQERLVHEIADKLEDLTQSKDVAVFGSGMHLCMIMRGVRTSALMTTSVMRGVFYDNAETRQEFLQLAQHPYGLQF